MSLRRLLTALYFLSSESKETGSNTPKTVKVGEFTDIVSTVLPMGFSLGNKLLAKSEPRMI
jgi:hypothetical protein